MHPITPQGLELIKRFEGFSAEPYLCPAGYWTIGWGHLLSPEAVRGQGPVDRATATIWLLEDIRAAVAAVARLIDQPLTPHQRDALVSFTFNLGAGALQRSRLRRIVNRADHAAVPEELLRWVWAGGRKLPGLIRRREAEGAHYLD